MPDNALAPVRQFEIGMPGEERRELRLDRLLDQPLRAAPQNFGQRIVNLIWLTGEGQLYSRSWRNAPSGGSGRRLAKPRYAAQITPSSTHFLRS